jgi:hypothetical protein
VNAGIVAAVAASLLLSAPVDPPDPPDTVPNTRGFWAFPGFDAGDKIAIEIDTNVTSGVAPLGVHFSARSSTGNFATLPYGELAYAQDMGDDQGASWSRGVMAHGGRQFSKNTERGPVTHHTFTVPGTYQVNYEVRDRQQNVKLKTVTITVTDPEDEFAGADTILISTGTDFTRGPGETYVGAVEVTATTFAGIAARCVAGKRVLLKCGDSWDDPGFLQITNVGPFHLGTWGDPSDGPPTLTGGGNFGLGNDDRDAPLAGSVGGIRIVGLYLNGVGIDWQGATVNTLFKDLQIENESAVCSGSVMNFFGHGLPDGVFFDNCTMDGVPVGSGNNLVFMAAKRQSYVGCRFNDSTAGEHCLRLSTAQSLTIAHCYVAGAPNGRHLLKRHAPGFTEQPLEGAGSPTPGVPNPNFPVGRYSEYSNIHDNVWENTEGSVWMVHPAPQNDATNERGQFDIFERNLFLDPNGQAAVMLFMCDVQYAWIRANAFNRGTGTAMHIGLGQRDASEPTLMGLHHCFLANNTHYGPSGSQDIIDFRGPFGSGVSWSDVHEVNGLIKNGTVPVDDEFTSSNNEVTPTPGLVADPPVTAADYDLQASSPARGAGVGEGAAFWDLFLRPIPFGDGQTVDVGCTQYEAA